MHLIIIFCSCNSMKEKKNTSLLPLHHTLEENSPIPATRCEFGQMSRLVTRKMHIKWTTSVVNRRFLVAFFGTIDNRNPTPDKLRWFTYAFSRHESQRTVVIARVLLSSDNAWCTTKYSCHPNYHRIINNTNMDAHKTLNHILLVAPIMGGDEWISPSPPPPPLTTPLQEENQTHHECPQNMVTGVWRHRHCCCSSLVVVLTSHISPPPPSSFLFL